MTDQGIVHQTKEIHNQEEAEETGGKDKRSIMFESTKFNLYGFEAVAIGKEKGSRIEIIPGKGGVIHQLYLGEQQIPLFTAFEDGNDLNHNPKFKQSLLFPFPNRLRDGRYTFNRQSYQFPINEPERNNALHGFIYNKELEITGIELFENSAFIELTYTYHGDLDFYPFPFKIKITYNISETGFSLTSTIENTGLSKMPYAFGWHPYFLVDKAAMISIPDAKLQVVNSRLLPTGEETRLHGADELMTVEESYDNAFRPEKEGSFGIETGYFHGRTLKIISDRGFKFFQLYNPEKKIIAIEPVTANIDALNTGDGLIVLEPGMINEHQVELTFSDLRNGS